MMSAEATEWAISEIFSAFVYGDILNFFPSTTIRTQIQYFNTTLKSYFRVIMQRMMCFYDEQKVLPLHEDKELGLSEL